MDNKQAVEHQDDARHIEQAAHNPQYAARQCLVAQYVQPGARGTRPQSGIVCIDRLAGKGDAHPRHHVDDLRNHQHDRHHPRCRGAMQPRTGSHHVPPKDQRQQPQQGERKGVQHGDRQQPIDHARFMPDEKERYKRQPHACNWRDYAQQRTDRSFCVQPTAQPPPHGVWQSPQQHIIAAGQMKCRRGQQTEHNSLQAAHKQIAAVQPTDWRKQHHADKNRRHQEDHKTIERGQAGRTATAQTQPAAHIKHEPNQHKHGQANGDRVRHSYSSVLSTSQIGR